MKVGTDRNDNNLVDILQFVGQSLVMMGETFSILGQAIALQEEKEVHFQGQKMKKLQEQQLKQLEQKIIEQLQQQIIFLQKQIENMSF